MTGHRIEEVVARLGLSDQLVSQRMAALDLNAHGKALLAKAWEAVSQRADAFIDDLYDVFISVPYLQSVLASEARVVRLKQAQKEYLKEIFCAEVDRDYVARRVSLGLVHHQLRITPQWYIATYAMFLSGHVDTLLASASDATEGREQIITMFRSILLDASFVLDAYGLQEDVQQLQQRSITRQTAGADQDRKGSEGSSATRRAGAEPPQMTRIRLTSEEAANRAAFVGLLDRDKALLRSLEQTFSGCMDDVLQGFYRFLLESPEYSRLIPPEQVERLIKQVRSYWIEFLSGDFDRPYAASRMRIGAIHEQIGVTPQMYLVGLGRQVTAFLRHIPLERPDYADVLKAVFKAIMFDITFVVDAYMESRAQTLLRTEGYANQLMSGLHAAVVVVDNDSRILFANREFVSLSGIAPSLLYRMRLVDALPLPEVQDQLEQVRGDSTGRLASLQNWAQRAFRVTAMQLEEHQDRGHQAQAVLLEDVSEFVRVMDDVEQDGAQFTRLANVVSAVLWEMEPSSRTIFTISHQAVELTGHRDVSILGKPDAWFNLIVEEDRERFSQCCQTLRAGNRATCDYRMIRSDGEEIWLRSHLTGISTDDTLRIAAVTVDITQARQAEKLRLASITKVSGGIAHVINNTLTVVISNIEMQVMEDDKGPEKSYLQDALAACHRAAGVVRQLQAFAGGQLLRPQIHSLGRILTQLKPALQELVGNNIAIETQADEPLWSCRIDEQQLVTALQHLCANARDAIVGEGTISITVCNAERASLTFDDPGFNRDWVELRVSDSGAGMSEEVRRRAAEPFFGTRNPAEHSGLGLSLVYGFVTQSGGYMLLQSKPGVGTDAILRFPKHEPAQVATVVKPSQLPHTVLIVDDDEAVAQSIGMQIRHLGYEVMTTSCATDALQLLETQHVDILLADVFLGSGMDGIEMAHQISARHPSIQVIIMSGYAKDAFSSQDWMRKWQFLPKPFSAKSLADVLQSVART